MIYYSINMKEISAMIEKIKQQVCKRLETDKSGHGMEHINSVLKLSLRFAETENADF